MPGLHSAPTKFLIASRGNPHIISGPLIEIGKVNHNKWGIPMEEAPLVKAGLLGVPLKICSGPEAIFNEHACDYNWDPGAEIGQIIAAHQEGGWIHATAKITDPVAQSKIDSGTWKKNWSIFGGYKYEAPNRMRFGTIPKSVTLVKEPAYTGATFNKQAASKSSNKERIDSMTGKDETYTQEELDKQIKEAVEADHATMTKEAETLQTKFDEAESVHQAAIATHETAFAAGAEKYKQSIGDMEAEIKKLQSAGKETEPDIKDMIPRIEVEEMMAAAKKQSTDDMIPRSESDTMISAAAKQAAIDVKSELEKAHLVDEILTMQASFNLVKPEEVEGTKITMMEKSAASLELDKLQLERMGEALKNESAAAVDKFKLANLPTSAQETGPKLDYDAVKGEWV
jgi:Ca2+-binding EF-hand superfamily protein